MAYTREQFTEAHNALAAMVDKFELRDLFLVPDLLIYHLALDVLEQGRAVAVLVDIGVGRPAYANSRAAFEAAVDMLLMVSGPDDYCRMGALARAWELVDVDRLQKRREAADTVLGLDRIVTLQSPDDTIRTEAEVWDQFSPGRGQLLHDALQAVRQRGTRSHWSGLTRAQIRERIAAMAPDPAGISEMMDALYGMQSVHVHPGSRLGLRETVHREDGTLFVQPREVDLHGPLGFSTMSACFARMALIRRPMP